MQIEGRVKDITIDYQTGDTIVSFLTSRKPKEIESECIRLRDKDLDIEVKVHRNKRSLNANSYFHLLVGKIAEHKDVRRSQAYVKNDLITSYGKVLLLDGEIATLKTEIPPETMWESKDLHCLYKNRVMDEDEDGTFKLKYRYYIYRGSHTYNTKEMSVLIDGTVDVARSLGIETMTPDELAKMKALWKGDTDAVPI